MQPIDIIDTAVKIGLGALIGGLISYFLEKSKQKNELLKELRRNQDEKLIEPILQFIDELLLPISEAYWSNVDQINSDVQEKIILLRNKECMIDARVAALGNKHLCQKFSELTGKVLAIRSQLSEGKINEARNVMQSSSDLAGEVYALLFKIGYTK